MSSFGTKELSVSGYFYGINTPEVEFLSHRYKHMRLRQTDLLGPGTPWGKLVKSTWGLAGAAGRGWEGVGLLLCGVVKVLVAQ